MINKNNGWTMNWTKWLLPFCMLVFLPFAASAQIVFDEDEEEEEDEEEVEMEIEEETEPEDTITVTDLKGNAEVIEFPEAMTYDLDSLLNLYMSKKYLTPDNDCRMMDVNPVFTKEEYIERLKRLPSAMEMPYNEVVQKFIDRYSGRLRYSVSYMLGAANFYMPVIEQALDAYGLPLELKYLPIIESALNPKAVSRVGATGLWQFMLNTGRQYGLEVNSLVDDRCDPIKASYAAAHYLRDLYKIYNDWNLVIAAYNCGPQNIVKAIHRAGGEKDYWQIYPYLPKETRGYVPAFIAANYIMAYYCNHNICPMTTSLPEETDTVMVSRDVHLEQIATVLNLDIEMLRSLNPQYRRDVVPGSYQLSSICLPQLDVVRFIDNQDSIYAYNAAELLTKRSVVAVKEVEYVPTYKPKRTKVRSRKVKGRTATRSTKKSKATRSRRAAKSRGGQSVTVRRGQTLSEIARRNGTTVAKLKRLNGIKGNNIQAGKKLKVK